MFITWRKFIPSGQQRGAVVAGPGAKPVRCERRINRILVAVRGFLKFAVSAGEVPQWRLAALYEIADRRELPIEAQGEDSRLALRMRARHRLHEPESGVDRASDVEIVAMFTACRSARDRLIVLLLARAHRHLPEQCDQPAMESDHHRRPPCDLRSVSSQGLP